jgi:hypothetical protein
MNVGAPARGTFASVATDDVLPGDRVEYIGRPVFDGIINTGEIGWVTKVEAGWVFAAWPRSGIHSVPVANVRLLGPEVTRAVAEAGNTAIWSLLGGSLKRSAQQRLHLLSRRVPLECFSGATVELGCDPVKLDLAARSQVELAWQVLAQQPVGVLVRSALPRGVGAQK